MSIKMYMIQIQVHASTSSSTSFTAPQFILKNYFIFNYVEVGCAHMSTCAHGGQKRSETLELEWQVAVSLWTWAPSKLRSSRSVHTQVLSQLSSLYTLLFGIWSHWPQSQQVPGICLSPPFLLSTRITGVQSCAWHFTASHRASKADTLPSELLFHPFNGL